LKGYSYLQYIILGSWITMDDFNIPGAHDKKGIIFLFFVLSFKIRLSSIIPFTFQWLVILK